LPCYLVDDSISFIKVVNELSGFLQDSILDFDLRVITRLYKGICFFIV